MPNIQSLLKAEMTRLARGGVVGRQQRDTLESLFLHCLADGSDGDGLRAWAISPYAAYSQYMMLQERWDIGGFDPAKQPDDAVGERQSQRARCRLCG